MKQPVDAAILESIASDKYYRQLFYDSLVAIKQEKLFPAKYFNQRSFAEAYIFNGMVAGEGPDRMEFLGERIAFFK